MQREQTNERQPFGCVAKKWFPQVLLALAILWVAGIAYAEEATLEQPAQAEQSESTADDTNDGKEASDSGDAESKSSDSEAPKEEMKQAEESSTEDKSAEGEQAAVETERPVEVEPPPAKDEAKVEKKPDEKKPPKKEKGIIGSTATLLEKQSELKFRARVDTGAKSCSLHVEEFRIEDESKKDDVVERMTENIGKVIHFQIKNGDDKSHILTSKIAGYVIVKNSTNQDGIRRYKVPITFRWKHVEKEVLVTLTDREHMQYPLLLGRNFLRGDFLVDVELDSDD